MYSENGKLESKLNISVITNPGAQHKVRESESQLSTKCVKCILDSFELNYGVLSSDCKDEILQKPGSFLLRHFFDFLTSFLIITPCIISFWRGTWDYALIYLDKQAFNVCLLHFIRGPSPPRLLSISLMIWEKSIIPVEQKYKKHSIIRLRKPVK